MVKKIAPSMMCADIGKLLETVKEFETSNIEYLHIDIMDGDFVPNFTLGTDYCKMLKRITDIPLDIHLMITNPEDKISWFNFSENDYVSVHYESSRHIHRALQKIKSCGAKAMLALNPATPIISCENVLDDVDAILIMTVNPGYAGQVLIPKTLDKIADLRKYLDKSGYNKIEIEVDGNVSFKNAEIMSHKGANIFVAGSSSIFSKDFSVSEGISTLRKSINS